MIKNNNTPTEPTKLFNAFKRIDSIYAPGKNDYDNIVIQLLFDEEGAYLVVVDKNGHKLDADYRIYHGAIRDLLKTLDSVQSKQDDFIGWDSDVNRLYLHDHGHLLWLMRRCTPLVDSKMHELTFAPKCGKLLLEMEPPPSSDNAWIEGKLTMLHDMEEIPNIKDMQIINESHVLINSCIYEISPIGENFRLFPLFLESFPASMLERSLSLLFSHFTGVTIRYGNNKIVYEDDVQASNAVLFQQVDESGALHMDIVHTLPRLPIDFINQYDITSLAVLNEAEGTIVVRNIIYTSLTNERKKLNRLLSKHKKALGKDSESLLYTDEHGFIIGKKLASLFLTAELGNLAQKYTLLGAEQLTAYKIKASRPKLSLNMSYGIDFLEGDVNLDIEGETFSLMDVLAQQRKNRYIKLSDGTHAVINQEYLTKLNRLFKKHDQGMKVSFFDLPLIEDLIDESAAESQFAKAREIFSGFNSLGKKQIKTPKIKGKLRKYQTDGLKWMNYLYTNKLGGCLADDMGLGKTVQTIALLSRIYPATKTPSLIIMPRSLLFNWQSELKKFCPTLKHTTFYGADRNLDVAMKSNLILTTYGMLRNNIKEFAEKRFLYIILDESQAIKNSNTQTAKSVLALKAKHRLALSGTPIENNLGELYSLFRFLNPAMFGSANSFAREYATPIHQHDDHEAARELRKKIYPFILRRLKKDVLKELPDKVEQILYIDMNPEQRKMYESRRQFYHQTIKQRITDHGLNRSRFFVLEALMELRQIASIPEAKTEGVILSAKREMLIEKLQESVLNGHKSLIFTNFLSSIEYISTDLEKLDIQHLIMTGATTNREVLVKQFQTNPDIKIFLMTLKTGGVGLNLTAADTVFIFDPWWNTAAELQATDRTHRIGQDKTVFTYKLIAKDTIEEKIVELQNRKKELFDNIISSDGTALKSLTEQDIDDILG